MIRETFTQTTDQWAAASAHDEDELQSIDNDMYDKYDACLDENFASPVVHPNALNDPDLTLEAAACRFCTAQFLRKALASLRHRSGLKKEILEDCMRREAEKDIEWDDNKKAQADEEATAGHCLHRSAADPAPGGGRRH